MVTRAEYLAGSLSRSQPWVAEGISRRQWERRRRKLTAIKDAAAVSPPTGATVPAKQERMRLRRDLTANGENLSREVPRAPADPADDITPASAQKRTLRQRDENLLMRRIHAYWDAQSMTHSDPQALPKAIHAIALPERLKDMGKWALVKVYRRGKARLPAGYDRWIDLVKKWDNSYTSQKARRLVDRLVTAITNRPPRILEKLFEHLEQQSCEAWSKKVKRLEKECERLEKNELYMPQMRELKRDDLRDRVYAELASGPKTIKQLANSLGRTRNAIVAVGQHLRDARLIETTTIDGHFTWTRVGTAPRFVRSDEAILAALKEGPMNVSTLAEKTGKSKGTIVKALQSDLLPNNEVIRTKRGIYALPETAPPYVSKSEAIVAALKKGPMTISELCQTTSTALDAIYQFIRPLLAKRTVIRTKRGVYALRGAAPVFITTDDAITRALRRKPMRLPLLAQHINKPPTTVLSALVRLKTAGTVRHDGWGAEYRLSRRCAPVESKARHRADHHS